MTYEEFKKLASKLFDEGILKPSKTDQFSYLTYNSPGEEYVIDIGYFSEECDPADHDRHRPAPYIYVRKLKPIEQIDTSVGFFENLQKVGWCNISEASPTEVEKNIRNMFNVYTEGLMKFEKYKLLAKIKNI